MIADFTVTEQMLKQFIKKVHDSKLFSPAAHHICVPSGSTQVDVAPSANPRSARRSQVYLIEEPMAAAIGAGLHFRSDGSMVSISRRHHRSRRHLARRHVYAGSVRVGGDKLDEAIINYISRNYGMMIGENTAENSRRTSVRLPGAEVKE